MNMTLSFTHPPSKLFEAAKHYKYLLDNRFKREYSLKVVGDKYILNKYNRMILYRCIHSSSHIDVVIAKTVFPENIRNNILCIDFYNVLITIHNIISGNTLYLGNDSFLRDMSGIHGRLKDEASLLPSLHLLIEYLPLFSTEKIMVYLESQISKSGEYASIIRKYLEDIGEVYLHKNVDNVLSKCKGIVATSDSVIHMKASGVIDIPRYIAEHLDSMIEAVDFSNVL